MAISTEGSTIHLNDGRVLIDGVASWWTACHGYNPPYIQAAMHEQLDCMPHVMFGGINHEPALRLAKRLAALTPGDLDHVFFIDSGSVAIEVAMKMAVQYWLNQNEHGKVKFLSFRNGYHGDTMGCMTLCDPALKIYTQFDDYMPQQYLADLPIDDASTEKLAALLKRESKNIAAVVIEPLVQGVGGMRFHDAASLQRIANLCTEHNILLIADEIFTGFGRTGTMFACEQANIVPDIMCIGKALSACTVTLAATIARKHVFDAFLSDDPAKALMHGPTYMANPLACAAANASLDLFEQEPRLDQARALETSLLEGLAPCHSMKHVVNVRAKGAIGVVQLSDKIDHRTLRKKFIDKGVWIRSWGDHIYLTPALNIKSDDLQYLMSTIRTVVSELPN